MDIEEDFKVVKVIGFVSILLVACTLLFVAFKPSQVCPVSEQGLSDTDLNKLGSMMLQSGAWTNDCGLLGKQPVLIEQQPIQTIVNTPSEVLACNNGPGVLKSIDQNGSIIEYCETIVSIVGCV